jgi:hypothetical protein
MKHAHYFKDVSGLSHIDVYRILELYGVTHPCIQHAIKKLLVSGGRGAKDATQDVREAMDTLERYFAMESETAEWIPWLGLPDIEVPKRDWIPWLAQPNIEVPEKVQVRLRDGTELTRNSRDLRWNHDAPDSPVHRYDIVAYRAAP